MAASKHSPKKSAFTFEDVTGVLTDRQRLFCMEYVRCNFNGSMAARKAGYEPKNARTQAVYLLANPNIQTFVKELKKDIGAAIGVDAIRIAQEYANAAFFDIAKIYDKDGVLKSIHKIDKKTRAAISGIKSYEQISQEGALLGTNKEIKVVNKIDSLDKLARMIGVDGVTKISPTDPKGNAIPAINVHIVSNLPDIKEHE